MGKGSEGSGPLVPHLSTEGGHQERLTRLAKVGTRLFGAKVHPEDVIGETLRRLTPEPDLSDPTHRAELGRAIWRNRPPKDFEAFAADPLFPIWRHSGLSLSIGDVFAALAQPAVGSRIISD